MFHLQAPRPRNTKMSRHLERLSSGRIWLSEQGRPVDGEPIPEVELVSLPETLSTSSTSSRTLDSSSRPSLRNSSQRSTSSRMQTVWTAKDDAEEEFGGSDMEQLTLAESERSTIVDSEDRAPSPKPSLEALDEFLEADRIIRLEGEIVIPSCRPPSFRYFNVGREVREIACLTSLLVLTSILVHPAGHPKPPSIPANIPPVLKSSPISPRQRHPCGSSNLVCLRPISKPESQGAT